MPSFLIFPEGDPVGIVIILPSKIEIHGSYHTGGGRARCEINADAHSSLLVILLVIPQLGVVGATREFQRVRGGSWVPLGLTSANRDRLSRIHKVIFLHAKSRTPGEGTSEVSMIVAKQRNGKSRRYIELLFADRFARFEELAKERALCRSCHRTLEVSF